MPSIFVSHSHQDTTFCLRLVADLRAHLGEDGVWFDTHGGLQGGDDWWDRIIAEITARDTFLVILSPAALASGWVREEMKIAFRQHVDLKKHLVPILYHDCPLPPDWAGIQFVSFVPSRPYADALADLLLALRIASNAQSPMSLPATSDPRVRLGQRLAQEAHTAFGRENWRQVMSRTTLLLSDAPELMTDTLWRERSLAAVAVNDNATALEAVDIALRVDPYDIPLLQARARALQRLQRDEEAEAVLQRALAIVPLDDDVTQLAIYDDWWSLLSVQQRWNDARQYIADALILAPDDPQWLFRRAEALDGLGETDDALSIVRDLTRPANALSKYWQLRARLARSTSSSTDIMATLHYLHSQQQNSLVAPIRAALPPAGTSILTCTGHSSSVHGVAWSLDGTRLASASLDRTVRVWDARDGQSIFTCTGHSGSVVGVTWSPDSTRLASASFDRTVRIWDAQTGKPALTCTGHSSSVRGVAWSPDSTRLASASEDQTVQVWDAQNGRYILFCTDHSRDVRGVAWSPDGTRLASASGYSVRVWDAQSSKKMLTCSGHTNYVTGVTWSPDGTRLASASWDKTVVVWDAQTGKQMFGYYDHSSAVHGVAWSPDGMCLASASSDQTVRVWNAQSGQHLFTCTGHSSAVHGVTWSPDSARLASASEDRTVRVWLAE